MSETELGRISIRLDPEIHKAYTKRAQQNRRTFSEEIRIALEIGLQGNLKIPLKGKINTNDKKRGQ